MAKFKEGNDLGKGRPKGAKNKITKAFKDLLVETIHALEDNSEVKEGDPKTGLMAFAKDNPKDFYRIASKLVPQEMAAELTGEVIIKIVRD